MFGQAELDRLQKRKELLVLQNDANRLTLSTELRRLRSGEFWQSETTQAARRHPLLTAALGIGAGVVALKALRHPGTTLGFLGKLGGIGSTLLSAWKLFGPK